MPIAINASGLCTDVIERADLLWAGPTCDTDHLLWSPLRGLRLVWGYGSLTTDQLQARRGRKAGWSPEADTAPLGPCLPLSDCQFCTRRCGVKDERLECISKKCPDCLVAAAIIVHL